MRLQLVMLSFPFIQHLFIWSHTHEKRCMFGPNIYEELITTERAMKRSFCRDVSYLRKFCSEGFPIALRTLAVLMASFVWRDTSLKLRRLATSTEFAMRGTGWMYRWKPGQRAPQRNANRTWAATRAIWNLKGRVSLFCFGLIRHVSIASPVDA